MPGSKPDHQITVKIGVGVGRQDEAPIRHAGKRCDGLLDVGGSIVDGHQHNVDAERGCRGLRRTQIKLVVGGRPRIDYDRSAREVWCDLLLHGRRLALLRALARARYSAELTILFSTINGNG